MTLDVSGLQKLDHIKLPHWLYPCFESNSQRTLPPPYAWRDVNRRSRDVLGIVEKEGLIIPTAEYLARGQTDKGLVEAAHAQLSALARHVHGDQAEWYNWTSRWPRVSAFHQHCNCRHRCNGYYCRCWLCKMTTGHPLRPKNAWDLEDM
jgi:hypothetical protein